MHRNLKTYCFDLDRTICFQKNEKEYDKSFPDQEMVTKINHLHSEGNQIIIFTARGMSKFDCNLDKIIDNYYEMTHNQLRSWNLKYDKLIFGKPSYDFIIDDKSILTEEFKRKIIPKKGFVAGMFDIIHPGYIKMFKEIKKNCDHLTIGLHNDASTERKNKFPPILTIEERKEILYSIREIDDIICYNSESDLLEILSKDIFDVRFLGDDYKDKDYTGSNLNIPIIYLDRSHGWSSTKFKRKIYEKIR